MRMAVSNPYQVKVYIEMKRVEATGDQYSFIVMITQDVFIQVSGMTIMNTVNLLESIYFSMLRIQESLLRESSKLTRREYMQTLKSDTTSS
jgi:hypothetical protein